jgi:hypothetical protein
MTFGPAPQLAPLKHDSVDDLVDVGERGDISKAGSGCSVRRCRGLINWYCSGELVGSRERRRQQADPMTSAPGSTDAERAANSGPSWGSTKNGNQKLAKAVL